eukprot:CAMPEP_0179205150 /NCGR_PEP_ID=MMETSP0796-20121207/102273_1 /TAXON_ID=73915 /ORGANISM="Pyrodinium bahamense, Strain pbaha01" /LENGTH=123 /DNA_ID=CAMNT_0020910035 /DNA_START=29 /DNA_END=395 /DNA_ORIENTATION=-
MSRRCGVSQKNPVQNLEEVRGDAAGGPRALVHDEEGPLPLVAGDSDPHHPAAEALHEELAGKVVDAAAGLGGVGELREHREAALTSRARACTGSGSRSTRDRRRTSLQRQTARRSRPGHRAAG